jgi:hypothetical protein
MPLGLVADPTPSRNRLRGGKEAGVFDYPAAMSTPTNPQEQAQPDRASGIADGVSQGTAMLVHIVVALVIGLWVASGVDATGQFPDWREGPGLTVDEGFNVDVGVRLADSLLNGDLPEYARRTGDLPDHPPLGRLWLGLVHEIGLAVVTPQPIASTYFIPVARLGSALAFAGTLILTGLVGWRFGGFWCGLWSILLLVGMPRVVGHAHIASLETVMTLAWMAVVTHVGLRWTDDAAPSSRVVIASGVLWGVALLVKVQGALLPVPLVVWCVWRWKWRAVRPLALAALAGTLVFFAGWPWLWESPVAHVGRYLGRAADRPVTLVWYLGQVWADRDVPWHYPWVLLCGVTPILALGLAAYGAVATRCDIASRPLRGWLGLTILTPLLVFSWPGVAVYDGERLFGVIFPAIAVFAATGVCALAARRSRLATGGLAIHAVVALWLAGPHLLDQYSMALGGPSGARALGLSRTYWGDAITRGTLAEVARLVPHGATVDVVPVLHPFQLPVLWSQTPALIAAEIELRAYDRKVNGPSRYLLVLFRDEYLEPRFRLEPPPGRALHEVRHRGVLLAGLYDLREDSSK